MSAKSLKRSQAMVAAALQAEPEDVRVFFPAFRELLPFFRWTLLGLLIAAICTLGSYIFIADMFAKSTISLKSIFGAFICSAILLVILIIGLGWLITLIPVIHKRFFVQANQQGVQLYSTPFIPWSVVQSIQTNFKDSSFFHGRWPESWGDAERYYSIDLQIDASWFQEHLQNIRTAKLLTRVRRPKKRNENTLTISLDLWGANALITLEKIKALRHHHNKRLRRWSPKLVQLLQGCIDESTDDWFNQKLKEEQATLTEYANQRPWDWNAERSVINQLARIEDLFSANGGDTAEDLEKMRDALLHTKALNEYKHLEAMKNRNSLQEIRFRRLQKELGEA